MQVYSIDGIVPVVDPTAFVHPTAVLIGDVIIGPRCYIGPNACLRGDFGRLVIKEGANVQDTCVMHGFPGTETVVDVDGHIGHGAVLHGCYIGKNALVGMNAVVMDNARIGEASIVAACAFVKADFDCPPRSLLAGTPAKIIRELSDKEIEWKGKGTAEYQNLSIRSLQTMQKVAPLTEVEPDRKRIDIPDVKPLYAVKQQD
ncbi:phenylacetic acid degradation protein [Oceanospirillum multiglobuliferum]|uniref:Phenylacetic acid degradation protein PaaY n=1 Tax=Oceanospirillum multiglobuliferum TaxID=64969 RepID=A0A1T4PCJ1_9GAMM|nr:phenylacetic acid degradation protein PaaY [Oceanospirillum multiglobuliferum]OPX55602.1 phenylacetic acid degradation protein PaaY [Oceanospirillum multiglobuliferum]SJZ89270.1 phenylacetic acid degradation protein [Oceanospirillum multiglobuliferum]